MEEKVKQEILRYVMGAIIVENPTQYLRELKEQCNENGLNFDSLFKEAQEKIPPKPTYADLMEMANGNEDKLNQELRKAFEMLKSPEGIKVRQFEMPGDKKAKTEDLNIRETNNNEIDIVKSMLIKIREDYKGYENNLGNPEFFTERKIKPKTKEDLDYIFSLDLNNQEQIKKAIEENTECKKIREILSDGNSKHGGSEELYYETSKNNLTNRIVINTSTTNETEKFLNDYRRMCMNRNIPFEMKGMREKDKTLKGKDKTDLYIQNEYLLDNIDILNRLETIYPEVIKEFGTPVNFGANNKNNWYMFQDFCKSNNLTTNDVLQLSLNKAYLMAIYSSLSNEQKTKLCKDFDIEILEDMQNLDFKRENKYGFTVTKTEFERGKITPSGYNTYPNHTLGDTAYVKRSKWINKLYETLGEEANVIIENNPEETFQKFKKYFIEIYNVHKINSYDRRKQPSREYTYEEIKDLPPAVSPEMYVKYRNEKGKELKEKQNQKIKIDLDEKKLNKMRNLGKETENAINEILNEKLTDEQLLTKVDSLIEMNFNEYCENINIQDPKHRVDQFDKNLSTLKQIILYKSSMDNPNLKRNPMLKQQLKEKLDNVEKYQKSSAMISEKEEMSEYEKQEEKRAYYMKRSKEIEINDVIRRSDKGEVDFNTTQFLCNVIKEAGGAEYETEKIDRMLARKRFDNPEKTIQELNRYGFNAKTLDNGQIVLSEISKARSSIPREYLTQKLGKETIDEQKETNFKSEVEKEMESQIYELMQESKEK